MTSIVMATSADLLLPLGPVVVSGGGVDASPGNPGGGNVGSLIVCTAGVQTPVDPVAFASFAASQRGKALLGTASNAYVGGINNPTPPLIACN
jgi:hypothetical protein